MFLFNSHYPTSYYSYHLQEYFSCNNVFMLYFLSTNISINYESQIETFSHKI